MAGVKGDVFSIFKTPPKSPIKSLSTPNSGSPGKSPKRKLNSTVRQGSTQNNKIFRYLKPKRLIDGASTSAIPKGCCISPLHHDKENDLELRVVLSRIDGEAIEEYCKIHNTSRDACLCAQEKLIESELVVQALDSSIQAYFDNPFLRLGIPLSLHSEPADCDRRVEAEMFSSTQQSLFGTMVDRNLSNVMVRECLLRLSSTLFPSAEIVHNVLQIMKMSVDEQSLFSCERLLQRLLHLHPPCSSMRDFYVSILHKPNIKLNTSNDYWGMTTCETFQSILHELEMCIEDALSPAQLKEKHKTPTVRKILKPRRYRLSPSPVKRTQRGRQRDSIIIKEIDFEDKEKLAEQQLNDIREQTKKERLDWESKLKAMSWELKMEYIFSRFKFMIDILEYDLVVWLSKHEDPSSAISDRFVCPLVVLALWKPTDDTGFDSPGCRRVFSLYASSWVLDVHPKHLKTLSRLIGLIAEVIAISDPSLKKTYPRMGDRCEHFAHKLTDTLRNVQLEDKCHEAVQMLKPVWLQMLVSAAMLSVSPSISSVDSSIWQIGHGEVSELWSVFLLAAVSTYHIKEADKLLQEASKSRSLQEIPFQQAPRHAMNYKILLNEIVAYYELQSIFKKSNVAEGCSSFYLFKEIFS